MSCDKESPARTWINSNCRCSAAMETRFIIEAMQDWWITKTWEREWNEKDWNMGNVHLVWDNKLKGLWGKNLKIGSRIVSFWQRTFESCYILTLPQTPASLKSYTPLRQVSLVEYLCTQGLLTLVAGESHAQACFGPCCMSVFEVNDDEEWWMAFGQGTRLFDK